jgi:serine/threonine protein phosphatase PrpC
LPLCFVASIGDSRVVRVFEGGSRRITVDAKPTDRNEYERLREAGLPINLEGRIGRKLAVSRSLGDFWCGDGVFVSPDVTQFEISEQDDAVIIACDGLWDVVSDDAAAEVVTKAKTAADAAVSLRNFAFALGSKDNITVIVIKLHPKEGQGGLCAVNTVDVLPPVEEEGAPEQTEQVFSASPSGRRRR